MRLAEVISRAKGNGSLVGKAYPKIRDGLRNFTDKLRGISDETLDNAMNPSDNSDNPETDSKIENKSKHNKTPSTKNSLLNQVHDKQAELKQLAKDGTLSSFNYTSKSAEFILS